MSELISAITMDTLTEEVLTSARTEFPSIQWKAKTKADGVMLVGQVAINDHKCTINITVFADEWEQKKKVHNQAMILREQVGAAFCAFYSRPEPGADIRTFWSIPAGWMPADFVEVA